MIAFTCLAGFLSFGIFAFANRKSHELRSKPTCYGALRSFGQPLGTSSSVPQRRYRGGIHHGRSGDGLGRPVPGWLTICRIVSYIGGVGGLLGTGLHDMDLPLRLLEIAFRIWVVVARASNTQGLAA